MTEPKTRHTCDGPAFGRLTAGCPRCDELAAGAAPRRGWGPSPRERAAQAERDRAAIRAHFAPGGPHDKGACGPVCTFGDW